MRRVITLSVFITLVLIVMLAKTSHAQRRVIYAHASPTATLRIWTPGFWKWSPRQQRYVWVDGYWSVRHPRRAVYVRVR